MHPPHTLLDVTLLHLSPVSQRLIQLEGHRLEVVLVVLELDVELRWSFYVAHPHRHYMERERERERSEIHANCQNNTRPTLTISQEKQSF